jgi:peptide/nickel transport system substrate-binding protein
MACSPLVDPSQRFGHSQRGRSWLAGSLALLAVLSACGDREPVRHGQRLVVLLPRDVQELDPRLTGDAYGHKVSRLLFASLVTLDPETLAPVLDLAERIDELDPTTYRVRLREGLRFSDGSALDARDVVATFESVVAPAMQSRYASTYRRIARMTIEDPLTVRFALNGPHATFITDLELPVVREEDRATALGRLGQSAPVGSGPYVLEQRREGRLQLRANPHWHRGSAKRRNVELLVVRDDNTRALRLLAGAGDVAINAVPPLLVPLFDGAAGFTVQSAPGAGMTYLGLNLEAPVFADPRVRAALAHAIDRDALIEAKLGGRARLADGFLPPQHWAQSPFPAHAYDPARARTLLDAAGKEPDPSGQRLRVALRCGSDRARVSIARAIAAMLGEVGVRVDVRPTETATLIAALNRGQFELSFLQVPEVVEPHLLSWFFGGDHIPGANVEGANRWRLRSTELDAALERGRLTTDRAQRIEAYRTAHRVLHEQLPVIPLWHEDVVVISAARVGALGVSRLGRLDPLAE